MGGGVGRLMGGGGGGDRAEKSLQVILDLHRRGEYHRRRKTSQSSVQSQQTQPTLSY